jgi:hypothetical protein
MPSQTPTKQNYVAEQLMRLFRGHGKMYGTHGEPTQKGLKWEIRSTAQTLRRAVTLNVWMDHVAGKKPLGIIPIDENDNCSWGSIDVDDYTNNLYGLIDRIEKANLPLLPCRSKSGGLHLFMFLEKPAPASQMQDALKYISATLGISDSEIFPKQTKVLTDRGDMGSWIVMPYYGDTFGGKLQEQVGLRKTGAELTADQFIIAATKLQVQPELLQQWQGSAPKPKTRITAIDGNYIEPVTPFGDGPVCLEILAQQKVTPGGQNNALLNMGIYFKRIDPVNWKKRLEGANSGFLNPPGSSEGLLSVTRSLDKKDYNYTCKAAPICNHCNSSLCRTRKFGVGAESDFPTIASLAKLDTDPPLWFADIDGRRIELETNNLYLYNNFAKVCFEHGMVFSMMKQTQWVDILRPLMSNCIVIDAPPEIGLFGQFKELLEEFCTNRQKGRDAEDILAGRPWEDVDTNRHYFRIRDFQTFLIRGGVKDFTRGQMTTKLKHLGGGCVSMKIKKMHANLWYVPSAIFEAREPIETPEVQGTVL